MFQPKARRVFPVLALTAALSLAPLADASAAEIRQSPSVFQLLAAQLEAEIVSLWTSLQTTLRGDAGPRMDDNGGS